MTKAAIKYYRVKISGTLLCTSNLHIGDGTDAIMEDERKQHPDGIHKLKNFEKDAQKRPRYNRFVRNAKGELYVPASTLRGALRQSPAAGEHLFGSKDTRQEKQQQGGKVRIYDANITIPDNVEPLAYWHSRDKTGLHAGVVINPQKGVAEHGKLFQHEVIPAGSLIHVKAEMDFATEKDLKNLLETLTWWNGDLNNAMAARKSKAWGRVKWKNKLNIKTQDFAAMSHWLINGGEKPAWCETSYEMPGTDTTNNVTLVCQQALLVNEPGQAMKKRKDKNNKTLPKDENLADQIMYRQANGKYAIPSQTVIGTLRSMARRIMLTQLNLGGWNDKHYQTADSFIESIFGNTRKISQIRCSNLETEETRLHKQYFIAVDRFTGGVVEGKLYIAEALPPQTTLSGQLLIPGNLGDKQKGLLYLSLRELQQGAWLGWGKSKGYGLVTLHQTDIPTLLNLEESDIPAHIEAFNLYCQEKTGDTTPPETEKTSAKCPDLTIPDSAETTTTEQQFYNPYSFIPLQNKWTQENRPDKAMLDESDPANNHARHDLYLPDCHSGIIRCCLTTVTDTLVGNQHDGQIVQPYRHNGNVAFPANSLRGMIGTTIEALSASSLRVLANNKLSVTAGQNTGRKKGWLIKKDGKLLLKGQNKQVYKLSKQAIQYAEICNCGAHKPINLENPDKNNVVWYKTNQNNVVIELSSSLRQPFTYHSTYQAFKKTGFENLLPWGESERDWLHPAELVLGIIEEQTDNTNQQTSLASRLRFTDALSTNASGKPDRVIENHTEKDEINNTILLKILASPKQPSEHMYYHKNTDGQLIPNGRKQYLRQHPETVSKDSYRSRNQRHADQKIYCNPVAKNQTFEFDIHFHNLNDAELGLLIKSIEPGEGFYHKLGLGKPLGLGTVAVSIKELALRDIQNDFAKPDGTLHIRDKNNYANNDLVDEQTLEKLLELGKLQAKEDTITYPLTQLQMEMYKHPQDNVQALAEEELFKWHSRGRQKPPYLMAGGRHKILQTCQARGIIHKGTLRKQQNRFEFTSDTNNQVYQQFNRQGDADSLRENTLNIARQWFQSHNENQVTAWAMIENIERKKTITLLAIEEQHEENNPDNEPVEIRIPRQD